jgi:hypothetical protein
MKAQAAAIARAQGGATFKDTPEISADPAFLRILSHLPPHVLASFTSAQLSSLAEALSQDRTCHRLDFLVSLPLAVSRYYLRVSVGSERRSFRRLMKETQISLPKTLFVWGAAAWLLASLMAMASLLTLYLVKCSLGLNFFAGHSPLHFIYELVFRGWPA